MGTFAGYYGDMTIPEEKRDEFNQRMLYLLEQGGMMNFERIQVCGEKITLLAPLKPDEENHVIFRYNWFEDDIWEPACYNLNTNKLHTQKVGCSQFCDVICAAYVFYEFYTKNFGIAERDGKVFDGNRYVGWLNYLFGENYTNARMEDPYRIYCLEPDTFQKQPLLSLVFARDAYCVSHVGFAKYFDAYLSKERTEQERKAIIRKAKKDDLKRPPYPPVEKLTTAEFLLSKGLSNDDRVYFWKRGGDVHFSSEMTEWMEQLRAELLEIKADPEHFLKGQDLVRVLVELLDDADKTFEVSMLQETFYDLLSLPRDSMRQAAVVLLQRLIERGKAELPSFNPESRRAWRERRVSPARLGVKRYLGLLGNLELRREVLGF